MGNGGKRPDAGRKYGSKDRLVRPEIEKRQGAALKLIDDLLKAAQGECTVAQKADIARTVLPYLLKRQPQAVEIGGDGTPILHEVRIEIVEPS